MSPSDGSESRIEPIEWPAPVRRVGVHWDGSKWSIVSEVRVASMTLPAPDVLPDGDKSLGFWIEAVDAKGRVLHRETIADPLAGMERFDEGGLVTRTLHPPHEMTIEVLVPDAEGIAELHLVSNPTGPVHHGGEARFERTVLPLSAEAKEPERRPPPDPPPAPHDGHNH